MMTIRCRSRFSALLLCLPLGLCFASTAWAASDDDEEWHDTKGPRSEGSSSDDEDSDKKADKKADDDSDKDSDEDSDKASKKDSEDNDSEDNDSDTKKDKKKRKTSRGSSSDTKMSVALLGSYGIPEPQKPGIGLRGGFHINAVLPLYVGVMGEYFFGSQTSVKNFGVKTTQTYRFIYLAGEAGVDVKAMTDLVIRPYFGLGFGFNTDENCEEGMPCTGDTKIRPTITPGVVGMYQIGSFFLGPDIRYIIVPNGNKASGVAFSLALGLAF